MTQTTNGVRRSKSRTDPIAWYDPAKTLIASRLRKALGPDLLVNMRKARWEYLAKQLLSDPRKSRQSIGREIQEQIADPYPFHERHGLEPREVVVAQRQMTELKAAHRKERNTMSRELGNLRRSRRKFAERGAEIRSLQEKLKRRDARIAELEVALDKATAMR